MVSGGKTGLRHSKHVSKLEAPTTSRGVIQLNPRSSDSQSKSTIVNIASTEETRATQDWFAEEPEGDVRYG